MVAELCGVGVWWELGDPRALAAGGSHGVGGCTQLLPQGLPTPLTPWGMMACIQDREGTPARPTPDIEHTGVHTQDTLSDTQLQSTTHTSTQPTLNRNPGLRAHAGHAGLS